MKQKAKIKSCLAFCELDELKQCISIGNGTIEVECNNLFHLSNLTIEYENKRQYPTYDTELYKAIFHQHLSGTSTLYIDNSDLQIADDACQYKDGSGIKVLRMHALHNLLTHRVHDVTNHRNASNNTNGLIHKLKVIAVDVFSSRHSSFLVDDHVIPTFGKSQEESQ
jgi:hypothetical protein